MTKDTESETQDKAAEAGGGDTEKVSTRTRPSVRVTRRQAPKPSYKEADVSHERDGVGGSFQEIGGGRRVPASKA